MHTNANKRWSEEEKNYVLDVWGIVAVKGIARKLGRSPQAIVSFAEKNNLGGCMLNNMYLTTTEASNLIGVDPTTIITWIKTNQLKARTKTMKTRVIYAIEPSDFKEFLIKNPHKWKVAKLTENIFNFSESYLEDKHLAENIIPKTKSLWTTKEELTLLQLLNEGKTSPEIAKILGRSVNSIRRKRLRVRRDIYENNNTN